MIVRGFVRFDNNIGGANDSHIACGASSTRGRKKGIRAVLITDDARMMRDHLAARGVQFKNRAADEFKP
jgi:hypothetical protein